MFYNVKNSAKSIIACCALLALPAFAGSGPSGPSLDYIIQGKIGEVVVNPYKIAPLTAVIKNGGYELSKVHVKIEPKAGGQLIEYDVGAQALRNHGGIPVFGLYPDYYNQVTVSYEKKAAGKSEQVRDEVYKFWAPGLYAEASGGTRQRGGFFSSVEVQKSDPAFADRLYFVNNMQEKSGAGIKYVWNNPQGGALEWNYYPLNFVLDSKGEVRWYMLHHKIYDLSSVDRGGVMMGFIQDKDGGMVFGYGQRYAKYDFLGREIFNRTLPASYIDFSHQVNHGPNGNYLLRVASANVKRLDGKNVRSVRDVVIEVDKEGNVIDEWRTFDILDPYRDVVIKTLDQGAVCLNIDESKVGQTLSAEEIAALDSSNAFGDVTGTGVGRNWAHINSVDYDASDDSIILSVRHQAAVVKIGRDKKIKWILAPHEGWSDAFKPYLLQPVDAAGKKIDCPNGKCPGYESKEGGFDYSWTQHTAYLIKEKSKKGEAMVSVFDNGDGRGLEQPAFAQEKYSRGVIYKVNEEKMTVEQVWEYGKKRGHDWFSPITSIVKYAPDKDSVVVYSATAGALFDRVKARFASAQKPYLMEFKYGQSEPSVVIQIKDSMGYQAWAMEWKNMFEK